MRISDWRSDVCAVLRLGAPQSGGADADARSGRGGDIHGGGGTQTARRRHDDRLRAAGLLRASAEGLHGRSEEHTSELQSLMRISYAVFCWKKIKNEYVTPHIITHMVNK